MKKLLALVLALVMTLGLATVSTSAAYTDADDIDYTEAVDVMTAVGVFQGKGDAFAPKDGLNRAEAAKLVAYLMLGNKTAESMKGSGTRFTDIPASHWASGYVEYLASVGVVSGVGGGQFNPNGQVTAVQFAKMLLVALGYDAELENFVGDGWSINIQKVANENDLFDLLDVSANDAVTREQAAQMCLNDLKADMVKYADKGTTVKIGESTVVTGAKESEKKTSTADKAKAFDDATIGGGAYYLQLGEDLYNGDLKLEKDNADDMGRPANQWKYKTEDVGTYAANDDLIFEAQDEVKRNKVYEVLGSTAADDLLKTTPSANTFEIWVDGFNMTDYFDASDLMDKNNSSGIGAGAPTVKTGTVAGQGTQFTGNGSTTQIYLDDSGAKDKYTFVIVNEYLVQATADYSTSREEVNVKLVTDDATAQPWYWDVTKAAKKDTDPVYYQTIENTIKQDDFDVSGVKKDDYLIVTYSAKEDSFQTVKPATMLEGEITKYVLNDTVTIDGTLYKYAKKVNAEDKATSFSVGNKVVMVTDGKYILAVDDANATKDYVYLQDVGKSTGTSSNVAVALYGTDGVLRDVKVKKITDQNTNEYNGKQLDDIANAKGLVAESTLYGWYTYSVDDSGVYTLKAVDKTNLSNTNYTYTTLSYDTIKTDGLKVVDGDKVSFLKNEAGTIQSIKANSKTVFIVLDNDDDITVYTGLDNAPTITLDDDSSTAAYISYVNDDGYATYVFVDLSDTTSKTAIIDDSTLSDDYIMVVKSNKGKDNYETKDNGNVYYSNTVLFDGGITTKTFEQTTSATTGVLYHKIKTNSKGYITGLTDITSENTKDYAYTTDLTTPDNSLTSPITFKNGTVTIGGNGYLLNSNDCVYLVLAKGSAPAQDKNKDFTEYLKIGGAALESYLKGYSFDYWYYGVRHDDNSSTLDALYVWALNTTSVNSLSEFKDPSDNDTYFFSGDVKMDKGVTLDSGATIYVDGELDTNGYTLAINTGTKLYVNSIKGATGSVALSTGGELYVNGTLETGDITVSGCKLDVANGVKVTNAITITGKDNDDPAEITFGGKVEAKNVELNAFSKVSFENGVKTTEDFKATDAIDVAVAGTAEVGKNVVVTGSTVAFKGTTTAKNVTITDSAVTVEDTMTVEDTFKATTSSGETTLNLGANVAAETVTVDGSTTIATTEDAEDVSIEGSKATTIDESVKVEDVEVVDGIDTARESALKLVEDTAKAYTDALAASEVETKDALAKDITNAATALTNAISKAETAKAIEDLVAEDSTTSAGTAFWNAIKAAGAAIAEENAAEMYGIHSVARWSDGKELFGKTAAEAEKDSKSIWHFRLGVIDGPSIEVTNREYDAKNSVSTVYITATTEGAMKKHYNSGGTEDNYVGVGIVKVDGDTYSWSSSKPTDVTKLEYVADGHGTLAKDDLNNKTGEVNATWYAPKSGVRYLAVKHTGETTSYTLYVITFDIETSNDWYKFTGPAYDQAGNLVISEKNSAYGATDTDYKAPAKGGL